MDERVYRKLGLAELRDKVLAGVRLSCEDGERLFACPDPLPVFALAHHARVAKHGDKTYYVLNRHINYTNICINDCLFCAFNRKQGQEGGFALSHGEILERIGAFRQDSVREIHIVGGCHPELRLGYFAELLRKIKSQFPDVSIKAFTMVEIAHFAALEGLSTRETLLQLKAAGLDMIPGGGAEIFAPEVRKRICPNKISGQEWLRVASEAHELGIKSNATMLFGHVESLRDRVEHLDALRRAQDQSGGFVCFIPLPFQTKHSKLKLEEGRGSKGGLDELKTIAVSRLLLDNFPHIKAYWVMLTAKLAQTALHCGADDLDGTVVEEKIGHMAGASSEQELSRRELEAMIRGCGFTPVQRDALFNPLHNPPLHNPQSAG